VGGAVLLVDTVFSEVLDGVLVAHSHERSGRGLEAGVERVDDLSTDGVGVKGVDDVADLELSACARFVQQGTYDAFQMVKKILELDEHELRLQVGVLGQVPGWSALVFFFCSLRLTSWSNSSRL
jgi:hypothetical protein